MTNSKLKDSNIEWLGKIPSNWNLIKGKYLFTLRTTKGNTKQVELLSPTQEYGVIPQKLYEKLTGMRPVKLKSNTDLNQMKSIYKGDFCISLRSFQGGFEYSNYNGIVSPAYQVFYPSKQVNRNYFKYLFKDKSFIQKLNSYTMSLRDGKNIAFSDFGNTYLPFPALDEQNKIADFLDKKVSQIDDISKKIQQEITDLEAYRKSVITKTITKGLNPNVPMKDSGIEWIGKIPTDWSVIRLKYLGSAGNGLTYSPQNMTDESGTLILRSSNIQHGEIVNADNVYVNSSVSKSLILKKDDLLICSRNGSKDLIGKNALINKEFIGSSFGAFMCVFRSKYNQYIYYVLNSNIFKFYVGSFLTSTINQLTKHNLYNLAFPFPQKETERKQIIAFLKEKCENINHLITHKKDQLKLLNQYKQSIIYEYVTGKKPVPTEEGVQE